MLSKTMPPKAKPEMLDIYDENMVYIGKATRDTAHKEGLWHKSFHCWFFTNNQGEPSVLFQIRSKSKADFPNMADISAAGHICADESVADGCREISEELGIDVNFGDLHTLGTRINTERIKKKDKAGNEQLFFNQEFNCVYFYDSSKYSLSEFSMTDGEVDGIFSIAAKDGLALFSGEADEITVTGRMANSPKDQLITLRTTDFVPRIDKYYLKIFMIADQYFKGYPSQYLTI